IFFPIFARRLEESPRWLERRGRHAEAGEVLTRIEREGPANETSAVEAGSFGTRPISADAGRIGIKGLLRSGAGGRALLLISVWFCQTLGFYGFNAWVPTL